MHAMAILPRGSSSALQPLESYLSKIRLAAMDLVSVIFLLCSEKSSYSRLASLNVRFSSNWQLFSGRFYPAFMRRDQIFLDC